MQLLCCDARAGLRSRSCCSTATKSALCRRCGGSARAPRVAHAIPLQSIGNLSQLIALNLDGNAIQVLPYEIFLLTSLKVRFLLSRLLRSAHPPPAPSSSGAVAARQRNSRHPPQRRRPHQPHYAHAVEQSGVCVCVSPLLCVCSAVVCAILAHAYLALLQLATVPEGIRKLTKLNELWLKNNPLPRCDSTRLLCAGALACSLAWQCSLSARRLSHASRAAHRPHHRDAVVMALPLLFLRRCVINTIGQMQGAKSLHVSHFTACRANAN
jgi:hypothetical protein